MPEPTQFLGALLDTRTESAKEKDVYQSEIVAAVAPVQWKEKAEKNFRTFPKQNQDGSGSCVMQTIRKVAGVQMFLKEGKYVEFSAGFYQLRSNRPAAGMIGVEAFDIWKNEGVPLEVLVESDDMNDAQMDAFSIEPHEKEIAKIFAITGHSGIANKDFEAVASTIQQTGKAVMVWFYFTSAEWSSKFPKVLSPNLDLYAPQTSRHSVAAVDFGLINGKKYIKIEDSAHFGGLSERWISEEFFKARNWFTRYPVNFRFQEKGQPIPTPVPEKPKYTFTKILEFIALDNEGRISNLIKNNAQKDDVIALQDILRWEGVFPVGQSSTGYYGALTAKGVLAFQKKYNVAPTAELDSLMGKRVGAKTLAKLNELYS